jgi:electron transfer flavoprotein beta subunit
MPEVIVCLKHVVDETDLRIDRERNSIDFEGAKTKISDDDKNAIEAAVKVKETSGGGSVTALCMGGMDAKKSLKEALAMGCDRARLLVDSSFQHSDAIRTAYVLSQAAKKIGKFDLVITASGTTDVYSGIVGPAMAEFLGLPALTFVTKIEVSSGKILAERSLEEGIESVESSLPAVVCVSREINQPRFPTLLQIMSAGKKEMLDWDAQALGIDPSLVGKAGSKVQVRGLSVPKSARKRLIFEGKAEETSSKLAQALLREGVVR